MELLTMKHNKVKNRNVSSFSWSDPISRKLLKGWNVLHSNTITHSVLKRNENDAIHIFIEIRMMNDG